MKQIPDTIIESGITEESTIFDESLIAIRMSDYFEEETIRCEQGPISDITAVVCRALHRSGVKEASDDGLPVPKVPCENNVFFWNDTFWKLFYRSSNHVDCIPSQRLQRTVTNSCRVAVWVLVRVGKWNGKSKSE